MGTPEPLPFRIGHDERERAVQALGEHFAKGRLEPEEFEDRVAKAYTARTAAELDILFQDLPRPAPPATPPQVRPLQAPSYPAAYDPSAPYGRDPRTGRPYSDKSKVLAGLLQLFLPFGVGRFYTGHVGIALSQLLLTVFGIGFIWAFLDGVYLLAGHPTDKFGRPLRG